MVRVVSCHHFISQDVFLSVNEPVAFCGAQNKLLISTVQHAVNVHDLDARGNVLHSFPTVDVVKQITYCESGNYIGTIENKVSWHKSLVSYVRIYFKWWIDNKGQPMKVRISGCAPTYNVSLSLNKCFEMVELPLEKPALFIACCNKTSALAVNLGNIVAVFCYSTKIDAISKQEFNDFDHFADIALPIFVQTIEMCENYFACKSEKAVMVFKIVSNQEESGKEIEIESVASSNFMDHNVYDENFVEWRFESCTSTGTPDKKWENHLKQQLHPKSFPINIHFHLIDKANEDFKSKNACEYHGPLLTIQGCTIDVRLDSKVFEMFPLIPSNSYAVCLFFKQFSHEDTEGALTALQLLPFYKAETPKEGFSDPLNMAASNSEKCSFSLPWLNLIPGMSSLSLKALGCFFSTPTEGFLYDLTKEIHFVSSFVYTAKMKGVVLDKSFLHALTDTGLETYTHHLSHSVFPKIEPSNDYENVVPGYEESVCLLGLRPFLGVDYLVKSDNHLVLISSVEDSVSNTEHDGGNKSTLYSLKEPSSIQIFTDLLEVAESQKANSLATFYHLLSEAHMVLRTLIYFEKRGGKEIESLFKKSCLLLADFCLSSDLIQKLNAVSYFHLSQLSPESVVKRILDQKNQTKQAELMKPLVHYLNSILFTENISFKTITSQSTLDAILTSYSEESPEMLWKVILCSNLTGYKIDKAILMLKKRLTDKKQPLSPISNAADTIALVYLLIQKNSTEAAQGMILSVTKADLLTILTSIYDKLWEEKSLTIFGKFLKQSRPDAFVELLLYYINNGRLSDAEVLNILQNESPNTELHFVPLLKEFLDAFLSDKNLMTEENLSNNNLLVKIYLKRLLQQRNKNSNPSSTFSGPMGSFSVFYSSRSQWLNEMPPFNGKGISKTCLLSAKNDKKSIEGSCLCCCWNCNEDLLRLQSILCHLGPTEDIKSLVLEFLCAAEEKMANWLSLEVMCSNESRAIKLLIGESPKAILPYANDTFKDDSEKWSMLFVFLFEHMKNLPDDHQSIQVYTQTFQAVLSHLAESLKPVELLTLLPKGENPVFNIYVQRSIEKHQADLLKDKIVALGQEIKSMMLT